MERQEEKANGEVEENLDHVVSQESEEKCFKKVTVLTILSVAKEFSKMRKELFPLGLRMWYYSTDMLWENIFTGIFLFLTCNLSFSAVTCKDYKCSFVKMNTQLFLLQNILCLPEENSHLH